MKTTIIFGTNSGAVPRFSGRRRFTRAHRSGARRRTYLSPLVLPGGRALVFVVRKPGQASGESDRLVLRSLENGEERALFAGNTPFYASSGHLVFVRGTTLMAAPFDPARLSVTRDPVALIEGVRRASSADYRFSDNGTLVYVPGGGAAAGRTLVWVGRDGREDALTLEPLNYFTPRISPDGQRVLVSLARISGSTSCVEVRARDSHSAPSMTLNHYGRRMVNAWCSAPIEKRAYDLYWTRADGTGTAERLTTGPQHEYPYAWSSGGGALLFNECSSSSLTGGCNVSLLPMEAERKPKVIVDSEFNEVFPAVSADGRWVAYQSNESGRSEIYVRPIPRRRRRTLAGVHRRWRGAAMGPERERVVLSRPLSINDGAGRNGCNP